MAMPSSSLISKMLKSLPKAVSAAVASDSPAICPRSLAAGISGGLTGGSVIPRDAPLIRLENGSFDAREPASPVISCIGQVKKKKTMKMATPKTASAQPKISHRPREDLPRMILKLLEGKRQKRSQRDRALAGGDRKKPESSSSHPKRLASGRGVLANLDRMAHHGTAVAPGSCLDDGSCSDNEYASGERKWEEEKIVLPLAAPTGVGSRSIGSFGEEVALQPKKEINLWKRRTAACPATLRL